VALLAESGFTDIVIPWRADVFRGAPQDKNSALFGTLGINLRAIKPVAVERPAIPLELSAPRGG
jgi:hypothetical protein